MAAVAAEVAEAAAALPAPAAVAVAAEVAEAQVALEAAVALAVALEAALPAPAEVDPTRVRLPHTPATWVPSVPRRAVADGGGRWPTPPGWTWRL